MDLLVNALGMESAKRFLTQSFPLIRQRNQNLRECLANRDWEQAAKLAHSIKGTVNLYGSPSLIALLENIIKQQVDNIYSDKFLCQLQDEQQKAEEAVTNFLSQ